MTQEDHLIELLDRRRKKPVGERGRTPGIVCPGIAGHGGIVFVETTIAPHVIRRRRTTK